jgi:pimeloyl-ACP methyl ester carboxylesterase
VNPSHWQAGPTVPTSDGMEIATWDLGGDGPPLLLTHGTGLHAKMWLPLAPVLSRSFRVWAMDQRGHGRSGHAPPESYLDWEGFASDILAVVDALGLDGADGGLVGAGHSLGGGTLIMAEERRPGTFAGLYVFEPVVVSPAVRGEISAAQMDLAAMTRKRRVSFESYEAASANFASKDPFARFRPDILEAYVSHAFVPAPDGTVVLACGPEEEAATFEGALHNEAWERLSAVRARVTVAGGSEPNGPGTVAAGIAAALPRGSYEQWPDLDHFGPMTDPDAVAEALVAALASR